MSYVNDRQDINISINRTNHSAPVRNCRGIAVKGPTRRAAEVARARRTIGHYNNDLSEGLTDGIHGNNVFCRPGLTLWDSMRLLAVSAFSEAFDCLSPISPPSTGQEVPPRAQPCLEQVKEEREAEAEEEEKEEEKEAEEEAEEEGEQEEEEEEEEKEEKREEKEEEEESEWCVANETVAAAPIEHGVKSRAFFVQSLSFDLGTPDAQQPVSRAEECVASSQPETGTSARQPAHSYYDAAGAEATASRLDETAVNGFHDSPAPETIFSVYQTAKNRNRLSEREFADIINELTTQLLPRNLSNSFEKGTSCCPPAARKMYAWQEPPPISPQTSESNLDETPPARPVSETDVDKYVDDAVNVNVDADVPPRHDSSVPHTSPTSPGDDMATGRPEVNAPNDAITCRTATATSLTSATLSTSSTPAEPRASPRARGAAGHWSACQLPTHLPADGLEAVELVGKAEPDNEYQYYKPKRSSSLKSARTPPDTPARKAVRFADVFGLDLTTVKTVFDHDAPPKIPASAMQDLRLDSDLSLSSIGAKHYRLCFAQPGASPSFMTRVLAQTVSLESADIDQTRNMLTGTVRVKSFGFEKHIFIRITFNNWQTHSETSAAYVQGSHDGMTDRFSFSIVFPVCMVAGEQAQFAIRYETHTGLLFWDNNYGQNYVVTCYAKHTDMGGDGSWIHYI